MQQLSKPMISIVLPAYNEGKFIEKALKSLESVIKDHYPYEVIVVNDGSEDDTGSRILDYASGNGHIQVVDYGTNVGKGYAVKKGFLRAHGDAVVFVDSDSDVDFHQISSYVDTLSHSDMVIGSKWHADSDVEVALFRRLLSRGFNVLVKALTGLRVVDTQTGLKAVKRNAFIEVFRRLSVKEFAFDVELLVLAEIFGLKVVEMPVKLKLDKDFSLRQAWRMLIDLLGITYRLRVKRWYQRANQS